MYKITVQYLSQSKVLATFSSSALSDVLTRFQNFVDVYTRQGYTFDPFTLPSLPSPFSVHAIRLVPFSESNDEITLTLSPCGRIVLEK